MASIASIVAQALKGLRTVGLTKTVQAGLYPLRRTYYEAKFSAGDRRGSVLRGFVGAITSPRTPAVEEPPNPKDWVLLGDALSHSHEGQTVTVQCQNAALQVTVLAADVVRVRLSPTGIFPSPRSYAVCKADHEWAPVPYTLAETGDQIEIRTECLTCRITKRPCRLSFWNASGQFIHADTAGLAWQGTKVARFAGLASGATHSVPANSQGLAQGKLLEGQYRRG